MSANTKRAMWEWLGGVLLGAVPLIIHAVSVGLAWIQNTKPSEHGRWDVDILYISMVIVLTSVFASFNKVIHGRVVVDGSGLGLAVLAVTMVLPAFVACIFYGSIANILETQRTIVVASVLTGASLLTSALFDYYVGESLQ